MTESDFESLISDGGEQGKWEGMVRKVRAEEAGKFPYIVIDD